ncbi:ABC transporter substrate-binding protein [Marinicrinis lubricantis]|uniref:ABC transporter substrate-binding protein n=1 Tax=Marinicrinis lubricantis TaxID=2086470 RepID=A0ABW1IJX2_9BACL
MKLKKTWLGIILSIILVITGCSGGNSSNEGNNNDSGAASAIEITMLSSWSTDTERGAALQEVIDSYNEQNEGKVKINVDITPDWPTYQEKIKTMISVNQTPDLFNYNFNPNDLSRQNSGKLLDFNPYMDDAWKARFNESDLEALTINGELTSIPFEKAGVLFYYNKDLFAQAGITEFPKTWDEFFAVCEQLEASGITPISLMTADDAWHATNAFTYLAAGAGGTDVFEMGKSLDQPAVIKAAENLKKLFEYTTEDALGAGYAVSSNHFILGNTAMIIDGPWLIGSLDPEMMDSIGVAPGPTFGDGTVPEGFIITDTYTPWSAGKQESKEKEEAVVDFMKYLTSNESTKTLTLNGSILLSPHLDMSEEELQSSGPILGQFITIGGDAPADLVQISRILKQTAISKMPSLIESLAFEKISAEQFAAQLQAANE